MDHQDHSREQRKLFIYHFEKGPCHLAELTATLVRWCQEGLVIKFVILRGQQRIRTFLWLGCCWKKGVILWSGASVICIWKQEVPWITTAIFGKGETAIIVERERFGHFVICAMVVWIWSYSIIEPSHLVLWVALLSNEDHSQTLRPGQLPAGSSLNWPN